MNEIGFSRRWLVLGGLASVIAGCTSERRLGGRSIPFSYFTTPDLDPRYRRQAVPYPGNEETGTIVVDTADRFLYFVEGNGRATRYGISVGEQGLALKGVTTIGRKAVWPTWTPTASMMKRKSRLVQYAGGVPGGPDNPLGARALYLYRGGRDTMFRLHGTNEPWSIGQAVSNGCVRLLNDDIIHLYERAAVGGKVVAI